MAEGALGVWIGELANNARTGEYAEISGQCELPSESEPIERHAVLRARLGGLEDTVELTWIEEPSIVDKPFVPDDTCLFADDRGDDDVDDDDGCACSADTGGTKGTASFALAALIFIRRRRC